MKKEVYNLNLPRNVAKLLYQCSGKDCLRTEIIRTFLLEADYGAGRATLISTNTQRMFVAEVNPLHMDGAPSGVYRWVGRSNRPQFDTSYLVEHCPESVYPNWRQPMPKDVWPIIGRINRTKRHIYWYITKPLNINLSNLPTVKCQWDVRRREAGENQPLLLVSEFGQVLLMPAAGIPVKAQHSEPVIYAVPPKAKEEVAL